MKILIINGPNINMLGIREKAIYGQQTYADLVSLIENYCSEKKVSVVIKQSNHEGDIVDLIQQAYFEQYDGVVINPAAYTHTSIAILDAIKAIAPITVVEVHISDINQRDEFRKHSYVALGANMQIAGLGFSGYLRGIDYIMERGNS